VTRLVVIAACGLSVTCALAGLAWSSWPLLAAAVASASAVAWQVTEVPTRDPTER